ncbi:MAG TPA: HAMP domain-containing sensor histidine kinase, partial [Methylomirabilota bacterium]|nr:HAMP domain-containing sensor histidine kinase [Methylomirabilota bacterium]
RLAASTREAITPLVRLEMRALVLADPGYATAWNERAVHVAEDLASLAEFVQSKREAEKLAAARGAFEQYRTLVATEQDLLRHGARAQALAVPYSEARTRAEEVQENLDGLMAAIHERVLGAQAEARRLEARTWTGVLIALGAAVVLALLVALENARLHAEAQRNIRQLMNQSRQLLESKVAAEQASRAKTEFLASMSHELRTPLNAVIGFSQVLANQTYGAVNERQLEYLTSILAGGRHLRKLVDDVLDLAKVDSGHLTLDLTKVSVAEDIPEVVGVVQALAHQKNITVTVEVKEPLPAITGDRMRVQQMIYNLLSNAIKFTAPGGHVTVTADTIASAVPNGTCMLRIRVADTGIGIKPEDQARIFDKFERGDSSSAREQEGTGLGLALTRKLVELHGGHISVESEGVKGRGSLFTVLLPLAAPEPLPS